MANYSYYDHIFGNYHDRSIAGSLVPSQVITMSVEKAIPIPLSSSSTMKLTMESSELYRMEAIGKIKMDSTGSIMLEPVDVVHLIPLHFSNGNTTLALSKDEKQIQGKSIPSLSKDIPIKSLSQQGRTDGLSPQHIKLVNPTTKTVSDPLALQLVSPGEGTDILKNPRQLLEIYNQSRAIIPKLELDHDFNVYFCKHLGHGVRFYFLTRESLLLHPRIHLVNHPHQAQYVVYLPVSAPWHKTECSLPSYRNKTIILDEGDGPGLFEVNDNAGNWFLYFKRSFVSRQNGIFHGYMPYVSRGNIFPMTYTTAEAYIKLQYNKFANRDLEIVCTLRGSNHDPVRLRVREWIEEYVRARGIKKAIAGQINAASRTVISKEYFNNMYRARIIVTSNPSGWEGGNIRLSLIFRRRYYINCIQTSDSVKPYRVVP